jgi:hypothetical protein
MPMNAPRDTTVTAAGVRLAVDALTVEVIPACREAGAETILLKGSSIIDWLYGPDALRYSVDVDLLVEPGRMDAAGRALDGLGFERREPPREERHAYQWIRAGGGPSVDLHRTLVGIGVSDEEAWDVLSRETEGLPLLGTDVAILAPAGRALHIALHAAQHGLDIEQSVADVAQAADRLPLELWQAAADLAERLEATSAFAAGLRLVPAGRLVADRLRLPTWKAPEVVLRETTAADVTLTLNRLVEMPGLRSKMTFALRRAFPPPKLMRSRSPLARRGAAGLAAAYVSRVGWLARRLPPATRQVVRARREGRRTANTRG